MRRRRDDDCRDLRARVEQLSMFGEPGDAFQLARCGLQPRRRGVAQRGDLDLFDLLQLGDDRAPLPAHPDDSNLHGRPLKDWKRFPGLGHQRQTREGTGCLTNERSSIRIEETHESTASGASMNAENCGGNPAGTRPSTTSAVDHASARRAEGPTTDARIGSATGAACPGFMMCDASRRASRGPNGSDTEMAASRKATVRSSPPDGKATRQPSLPSGAPMATMLLVPPCRSAQATPASRRILAAQSSACPLPMPPRSIDMSGLANAIVQPSASIRRAPAYLVI